jgi:hypothetical protein
LGIEGTSGVSTDDWEIFRLDKLEPELFRGACGSPDRGYINKN